MQQIGRKFNLDPQGIATFKVMFLAETDEELLTVGSNEGPLGLPEIDRDAQEANDGGWDVIVTYQGKVKQGTFEDSYTLDTSTSEEPIETHPDFLAFLKKYKGKMVNNEFKGFAQKLKDAGGQDVKNPMFGVTSYKERHFVWSRDFTAPSLLPSHYQKVGFIDNPPSSPDGRANPPTPAEGGNYLKDSLKGTYKGNVWSLSENWIGSGRGGFIVDIYRKK